MGLCQILQEFCMHTVTSCRRVSADEQVVLVPCTNMLLDMFMAVLLWWMPYMQEISSLQVLQGSSLCTVGFGAAVMPQVKHLTD